MAKTKVEVLNAVVDGRAKGERMEIDSRSAVYFESIGYVKVIAEMQKPKPPGEKKDDKPKEKPKKSKKE